MKELSTQQDLKLLEASLKRDISETKAELIRWVVAVGGAASNAYLRFNYHSMFKFLSLEKQQGTV